MTENILDNVFYGNTLQNWGISLLIIVGAVILNKGVVLFNKYVVLKITANSKNGLDDILFRTIERPVLYAIILAAVWIAANRLEMNEKVHEIIVKAYQILTILNITWLFASLAGAFIDEYSFPGKGAGKNGRHIDNKLLPLVKRGILILIWVIGLVTALNNVGVKVTTLLGTLGIGGIAFALAAQDTIKNIFGGITIFTDRPFRIGDIVQFDTIEGTVEDIGIRSTRIRTYEKRLVTVPNFKVMDAFVTNISIEPQRRVLIKLGLTYDTTPEQMCVAIDILKQIPQTLDEIDNDNQIAEFSEFGDSALIITYIYFIQKPANIIGSMSKVNFEILRRFNEAGLNFAFPSQTVYLEKD